MKLTLECKEGHVRVVEIGPDADERSLQAQIAMWALKHMRCELGDDDPIVDELRDLFASVDPS